MNIESIIQIAKKWRPETNTKLLEKAYACAKKYHEGQKRATGEEYLHHCLATAHTLAAWGMDDETIAAGLLHDVLEDTTHSPKEMEDEFGKTITYLVQGVSKLKNVKYRGIDRYVENLRKMCLAMTEDVRVMIIKFADRLHNLSTLNPLPREKQKRIALESVEIYAAIANRLGMGEIKGQIEDLAFPYIMPDEYQWLAKKIRKPSEEKMEYLKQVQEKLEKAMNENEIHDAWVHGRAKHMYSLYMKLLKHNKDISKIHDLVALRVVVNDLAECYTTLGIIHEHWRPLKGRIKDYIAQPKPNGYRSLHTTVFCDDGEIVEFQIRTKQMHEEAEFGIAAHWQYSESQKTSVTAKQPYWMEQLAKLQKEIKDQKQFLESLKIDFFKNRIFVFTPMGDVIDLPENATPIDFAYQIHTELGNTCSGVKINDNIASLNAILKNGDVVEIFKDKKRKGPNPDWLKFVITNAAKAQIKNWMHKNENTETKTDKILETMMK